MMNTKLCIILVNYNGFTDTAACIASILESDRNDYQIIVVDNGSTVVAEENTLTYKKKFNLLGNEVQILALPVEIIMEQYTLKIDFIRIYCSF